MIRQLWAAVLILLIGAGTAGADSKCTVHSVDLRGDWGQARFNVEIADDVQTRAKGLMFRERLGTSSGMLFIYDAPLHAQFWMKNTLIPLDIIFLDKHGQILRIAENAKPRDETRIDGGKDVLLVLEINGGMVRALGITQGSHLRHPAIDSAIAAWPCPLNKL